MNIEQLKHPKVGIYAIKDTATGTFGPVFESENNATAMRNISHYKEVNEDSLFSRYPSQYVLYFLGHKCPESGEINVSVEYVSALDNL